jgi:hypothetical protein
MFLSKDFKYMNKIYLYFRKVFHGYELTRETHEMQELEGDESRLEECSQTLSRVIISGEEEENP